MGSETHPRLAFAVVICGMGSSHSFGDVCPSAPSTCGYVWVSQLNSIEVSSIEVSSSPVLLDFGSIVFLEH